MNNNEILFGADPDAKLDTGMKVQEALKRAEDWWMRNGRQRIKEVIAEQEKLKKGSFSSQNPDDSNYMPSGIINGTEWGLLNKREKLFVVKCWHHFHVRMHEVIGTPEHEYKFGQRSTIN